MYPPLFVYRSSASLYLVILLSLSKPISTQFTSAECTSEFEWMYNDKGDTPCTVAAQIQGLCYQDSGWFVPSLAYGLMYLSPTREQVERCACLCNTVIYNLMSSCAACQDRQWLSYPDWVQNCSSNNMKNGTSSMVVPANTSLPSWALMDSSKGEKTFDLALAYTLSNHGTGSNPYESGGLSTVALIGICVSVAAVIAIAVAIFLWRGPTRVLSFSTNRLSSSKLRTLLLGKSGDKSDYEHLHGPTFFQAPPLSPTSKSKLRTRVASSTATSDFYIDKDTSEGPPSPQLDTSDNVGGVHGRLMALFGHQPVRQVQVADLGGARDFTFVSSRPSSALVRGDSDPHELQSFLGSSSSRMQVYPGQSSSPGVGTGDTIYPSDSVSIVDLPLDENGATNQRQRSYSYAAEKPGSSSDLRLSFQRSRGGSESNGTPPLVYPPGIPMAKYGIEKPSR